MDYARLQEQAIRADEYQMLGYSTQDAGPSIQPLHVDVNPIFRREAWRVTTEEYTLLLPVFRLATAMLQSTASKQFLCDLIYAERQDVPNAAPGKPNKVFHRTATPTHIIDQQIWKAWLELSRHNYFYIDSHYSICRPRAVTSPDLEGNGVRSGADLKWDGHRGIRTCVGIKRSLIDNFRVVCRDSPPNGFQRLLATFDLAKLLCHENSHMTEFARGIPGRKVPGIHFDWSVLQEPFFESQRIAEVGHAWTQFVFGGDMMPPFRLDPWPRVYYLHEWPTVGLIETEEARRRLTRWLPPPYTIDWILDIRHVAELNDQRYWDSIQGRHDLKILHFPKLIGALRLTPQELRVNIEPYISDHAILGQNDGPYLLGWREIVRVRWLANLGPAAEPNFT